jgi:hypothetical protein
LNLSSELQRLTGRMRKARRRGRPHSLRSATGYGICAGGWIAAAFLPPYGSCVVVLIATGACLYAIRSDFRARIYQRVVDRCQGAILTLIALQDSRYETIVRGMRRERDKRRWS